MTLPQYRLPEEEEDVDMDATAPAQFVLKLPKSFARRLAQAETRAPTPTPMAFTPFTPPAPWTVAQPKPVRASADRTGIIVLFASVLAGILLVGSVGVAATSSARGPIGIARRAPKSLVKHVRSSDRRTGVAPRVHATPVSIESLARTRRAPTHRPHHHARR